MTVNTMLDIATFVVITLVLSTFPLAMLVLMSNYYAST